MNVAHHHARVAAANARAANNGANDGTSNGVMVVNSIDRASQWNIIDMGGMQIKNLSRNLFHYHFLTTLYLNHNNLTNLSSDVCKLVNLRILDLSGNQLTAIPPELGLLVQLRDLRLFDNVLSTVPFELGFLFQLEILGLEGNPLQEPLLGMVQKENTATILAYMRDNCPMGPQPPEREWIPLEDEATASSSSSDTFTVLSYNILCEKYSPQQSYAYTPSWALEWSYRRELLIQEILNYNPDIVCLQEVELGQYEDFFREQLSQHGEYDGVFHVKSRARTMAVSDQRGVDGCATFYKNSKFTLIDKSLIEYQHYAMKRPGLRGSEDVINRVMIKDNVAVAILLETKETHQRLVVANTHLHWDPQHRDVKLVQTAILMEELQRIIGTYSQSGKQANGAGGKAGQQSPLPLILCGDFNSMPDSGVYEYLSSGQLSHDHEDFGTYTYLPYTADGLNHKLLLKSAYAPIENELEFTNYTPGFKGVIDYIWYSSNTLTVTGLLGGVDREYVTKQAVGFPNSYHPSDHIPLVVSVRIKSASGGGNPNAAKTIKFK
ncbi:Endonuclease/exonuclease/phosphatase [Polychytrium aggregatum]|uniref:Endonuclease/exonuclease/phosphatase n=1 Tax=Polychytrium aggregatum TaxID=110093 RepID=UPI0022FE9BBF|nr:Endonuclease/exonuclease/phosphatase [Polychytrium aggregatum]KAI9207102.1 Endonuclease/exonuclease/phosphatase [Polychytrium aggregatum]